MPDQIIPEVQIDTINACNAACTFCFRSLNNQKNLKRPKGIMRWDNFVKIIDENPSRVFNLSMFGEPLLDGELVRRIAYIHRKYPHAEIYFHTNGSLLNQEKANELVMAGLSRIVISCYGIYEQHDRLQPPTKFEHVVKNTIYMSKKIPVLIVSNLVAEFDMESIRNFWKQYDLPIVFDSGFDWGDGKTISPKLTNMSQCGISIGKKMFVPDGNMVTCCFDYNGANDFGNINREKWEDAVKNMAGRKFDFCKTCQFKSDFDVWRIERGVGE